MEAQLQERQRLHEAIKQTRNRHAQALRELHFETANYRLMRRGEEPQQKPSVERTPQKREPRQAQTPEKPAPKQRVPKRPEQSMQDRLDRLRTKPSAQDKYAE